MKKFLLGLMCATALVISANANAKEKKDFVKEPPRFVQMSDKLADDLGLTDKQKEQAEKIRKEGREKIKPLMEKMKKIHEEMNELREENMKDFEKILTPEQQKEFEKIKTEMKKHKGPKRPRPHKGPRPEHDMRGPKHPAPHPEMLPEDLPEPPAPEKD